MRNLKTFSGQIWGFEHAGLICYTNWMLCMRKKYLQSCNMQETQTLSEKTKSRSTNKKRYNIKFHLNNFSNIFHSKFILVLSN